MPDTILSLGLAVAFVLPGFVIADLAESRRATRAARSDLELVLRGLVYALILHSAIAFTGWTDEIVGDLNAQDGWQRHLGELATFALAVGVVIPTCLGLFLSWWLRRAEQSGRLSPWYYALGGRDHREAWDYVFGRRQATYLLLTISENGRLATYWRSTGPDHGPRRPPRDPRRSIWRKYGPPIRKAS